MTSKRISLLTAALVACATVSGTANAGTLENMERERAIMVEAMLSPGLAQAERREKVTVSRTRLIDLERVVLRDKSLSGRNTPVVRTAFANYDLTFLVHASTEKNMVLIDHWLEQVGVSTQALANARVGRR